MKGWIPIVVLISPVIVVSIFFCIPSCPAHPKVRGWGPDFGVYPRVPVSKQDAKDGITMVVGGRLEPLSIPKGMELPISVLYI